MVVNSSSTASCNFGQEIFYPYHYKPFATRILSGGRGQSWFVENRHWKAVLRPYFRGGFIAKLSCRDYIWLGETYTRSFREFFLLKMLRENGLLVPMPLGAVYWRRKLTYQASILVERIPNAKPLACFKNFMLIKHGVANAIAKMHLIGVLHADLNAFNILIDDQNQVWLIDFDRSTYSKKNLSSNKRLNNLHRLRRSLRKVRGIEGDFFWKELNQLYWKL